MSTGDVLGILFYLLLAAVPLAVLVGFIVSLVKFIKCPKENSGERKGYKFAAIILGTVFGIMVIAVVALIIMLAAAVMYM